LDYHELKGVLADLDRTVLTELRQAGYGEDVAEQLTALDHADRLIAQAKELLDDHRDELTTPTPHEPKTTVSHHYGG
jgi:hypothetical protein